MSAVGSVAGADNLRTGLARAPSEAEGFERRRLDRFRHIVLLVAMPLFLLSTGLSTGRRTSGRMVFEAAGEGRPPTA